MAIELTKAKAARQVLEKKIEQLRGN